MEKLVRLLGVGVLVVVGIRILDWFLAPALSLLLTLLMLAFVVQILFGRRNL